MTLFDYHNINFVKLDKSDRLGLVYRGSKRNIADDILKAIYDYNPNAYAFYDLFGGGGSMSLYAKKCGYDVYYNDLNKHIYGVIDYFKKHRNNLDSRLYDFLSREEFYRIKEKENKTPVEYVMLYLHSFSNNFKEYFCKKEDEEYYKHFYNFVVKNSYESACYFDSYALKINSISDIEISNKDYREVEIKHNPSDCIIYCDIPYKNTGKYIESLNHNEFYKWCFEKKEQGYNVFVSEYDMPLDFKCIFEKEHIKKIGVQNNLKSIERLYIL